jgi:hypothetical protein
MVKKKYSPNFPAGIAESFNIYQATVAMLAIFIGFVFSGLLQMLTGSDSSDPARNVVVFFLTLSMVMLTFALLCFHATAHRVLRYWRIFYPVSIFNKVGAQLFGLGLLFMFWSIAVLLWIRTFHKLGILVAISGFGLVLFGLHFRRMHGDGEHMVPIDEIPGSADTPDDRTGGVSSDPATK